jgi:hypothetical protein
MSKFEAYSANMPIFFPDKAFIRQYAWPRDPLKLFSQLSFHRVYGQPDPNNFPAPIDWWIDRTDALDPDNMPYVIQFSSAADYLEKVRSTDYVDVSRKMKAFNLIRKQRVYDSWTSILNEIAASLHKPLTIYKTIKATEFKTQETNTSHGNVFLVCGIILVFVIAIVTILLFMKFSLKSTS